MSNQHIYTHFKNDEDFVKTVLDYKYRALENYEVVLTAFLNPYDISIIESVIGKNNGLKVIKESGIEHAEYARVIIVRDTLEVTFEDFNISKIKIAYPSKFLKLEHRDVLGALMSLGVKRERFGDILIDNGACYFVCDKSLYPYLLSHLKQISKAKIKIEEVSDLLIKEQNYMDKTFFVTSFRLDVLISTLFSISRKKASQYILSGFVKVNYKEVEQTNFLCHNRDIVSLRKHGRVEIKDLQKQTRNNNHMIEGRFYK